MYGSPSMSLLRTNHTKHNKNSTAVFVFFVCVLFLSKMSDNYGHIRLVSHLRLLLGTLNA